MKAMEALSRARNEFFLATGHRAFFHRAGREPSLRFVRLLHAATGSDARDGIDVVTIMAGRGYAAVSEQFTHFGTLQFDGGKIDNPTGLLANIKTLTASAASRLRTPALPPSFLVRG